MSKKITDIKSYQQKTISDLLYKMAFNNLEDKVEKGFVFIDEKSGNVSYNNWIMENTKGSVLYKEIIRIKRIPWKK